MNQVDEYNAVETIRLRMQPKIAALIYRALNTDLEAVVLAVENNVDNPERFIDSQPIRWALEKLYTQVGVYFAKRTYRQLDKLARKDRANDLQPYWLRYMNEYIITRTASKVTRITNTSKSLVKRIIARGQQNGYSVQKIAKTLRDTFKRFSRKRAIVIARTETIASSNAGSLAGAKYVASQSGVRVVKRWLPRLDKRTRDTHANANGQERELDEPFDVGGEKLQHPGDPNGSAENIIMCRCTIFYRVVD